ncbi:hypothetical protein ATY30_08415 [Sinorhizobium americanum]|nr:hypothetical protein CO664_04695 [Sinorhizobium sp. NG07B]POH31491.1 hypothetical protein ATY30_08415 [Sinorhizobium americanum]
MKREVFKVFQAFQGSGIYLGSIDLPSVWLSCTIACGKRLILRQTPASRLMPKASDGADQPITLQKADQKEVPCAQNS